MTRKGFTLVEFLVVVVILGILAAILVPVFNRARKNASKVSCQNNLKQIGLGFLQYTQDYNEKLPPISAGDQGWADTIQPYLKSWPLFQCPDADEKNPARTSDYFLNARVAGLGLDKIPAVTRTILAGDGIDNGATNSHLSELPFDWKRDEKSPARRYEHYDSANYLFADGHVKLLKPKAISMRSPLNKNVAATFAVR